MHRAPIMITTLKLRLFVSVRPKIQCVYNDSCIQAENSRSICDLMKKFRPTPNQTVWRDLDCYIYRTILGPGATGVWRGILIASSYHPNDSGGSFEIAPGRAQPEIHAYLWGNYKPPLADVRTRPPTVPCSWLKNVECTPRLERTCQISRRRCMGEILGIVVYSASPGPV